MPLLPNSDPDPDPDSFLCVLRLPLLYALRGGTLSWKGSSREERKVASGRVKIDRDRILEGERAGEEGRGVM